MQFTSYLSLILILKYKFTKLSPSFLITLYNRSRNSESDDGAVHNGTHQETREEATSQSDMEKREMRTEAKSCQYGWDKETKKHLSGTNDQAYFAMEGRQCRKSYFSRPCNFLLQATGG
jgi:hypothetical protein